MAGIKDTIIKGHSASNFASKAKALEGRNEKWTRPTSEFRPSRHTVSNTDLLYLPMPLARVMSFYFSTVPLIKISWENMRRAYIWGARQGLFRPCGSFTL